MKGEDNKENSCQASNIKTIKDKEISINKSGSNSDDIFNEEGDLVDISNIDNSIKETSRKTRPIEKIKYVATYVQLKLKHMKPFKYAGRYIRNIYARIHNMHKEIWQILFSMLLTERVTEIILKIYLIIAPHCLHSTDPQLNFRNSPA